MSRNEYIKVIGLEVHVELMTESKIFCRCSTRFEAKPNTLTCPVCMGMPGTLPVLNSDVVRLAVKVGLATECNINKKISFDRKNYLYPDNPQNYQITQFYNPISKDGKITVIDKSCNIKKEVRIKEIHMEEDAGKLIHSEDNKYTYIDFNRAGVPLIEIVTMPDMNSEEEVISFLENLKDIIQYTGASDCKLNEGSMRVDVNLSVLKKKDAHFDKDRRLIYDEGVLALGTGNKMNGLNATLGTRTEVKGLNSPLGTRTEMKNLNSFRAISRAIEHESSRQIAIIESGGIIYQETRRWDDTKNISVAMRSKEDAKDYRYFPEPDIVPIIVSEEYIENVKNEIPMLRRERIELYVKKYGLPEYDAILITATREMADFFEETVQNYNNIKKISNWIMSELLKIINDSKISIQNSKLTPIMFAELIQAVDNGKITRNTAKEILFSMFTNGIDLETYLLDNGVRVVDNSVDIEQIVKQVFADNPKSVADYQAGKKQAAGFLIGQTMKAMKGQADPQIIKDIVEKNLREGCK